MREFLIAIIIAVIIYFLFKLFLFLKKKGVFKARITKNKSKEKKRRVKHDFDMPGRVRIVDQYMHRRELAALIALNKVLPRKYIALPKVGIANLVMPEGTRNLYNVIKDYFVDFVVFEEATMKPVLIVDVYDNSFEDELLKHRHPDLIEVLEDLKLQYVEFALRGDIDFEKLKSILFKALGYSENVEDKSLASKD